MPTRRKPVPGPSPRQSKGRSAKPKNVQTISNQPTESLTPAQRLAHLLKGAHERGIGPMTEGELARLVEENRDAWPDHEEIDAFVAWLHRARREGRYD